MNVKTTEMRMFDGSYNRVAAFARDWKAARQQEQQTDLPVGVLKVGEGSGPARQPVSTAQPEQLRSGAAGRMI
jgi:hypothetical protein